MAVVFEKAVKQRLNTLQSNEKRFVENAWAMFKKSGLPSQKSEIWHYTPLSYFELEQFEYQNSDNLEIINKNKLKNHCIELPNAIILVFYNGKLAPSLSSPLPNWVQHNSTYSIKHPIKPKDLLLLNQIFCAKTCIIKQVKQPLYLIYLSDSKKQPLMNHPVCHIQIQKNTKATIIEHNISLSDTANFQNTHSVITLDKNASLDYCSIHQGNQKSLILQNTQFNLKQNSILNCFLLPLSAKLNHVQLDVQLQEEQSQANIFGLGFGKTHQHLDCYLNIRHLAPRCKSHSIFRGIFDDHSQGAFTGKIQVSPNTSDTETHFESKNILLTQTAKVFVRPQLEIKYDEVQCTHGATIGALDENALFYLQSRGIDRATAKNLLLQAFLRSVIQPLKRSSLCGTLKKFDKIFQS